MIHAPKRIKITTLGILPGILWRIRWKNELRGSGGGAPSEKMEFLVGENLKSYTKIHIDMLRPILIKSNLKWEKSIFSKFIYNLIYHSDTFYGL